MYISEYCNGIQVKIIQNHEEGDRVRKHKKKRINKKYLKKYGVYGPQKLDKGQILEYNHCLYMSKQTFNEIKRRLRSE